MINRQIDINYNSKIDPNNNMFLLPRIYRTCILKEALNNIKNNLSIELFKNIKAMDLELIYYEVNKEPVEFIWEYKMDEMPGGINPQYSNRN